MSDFGPLAKTELSVLLTPENSDLDSRHVGHGGRRRRSRPLHPLTELLIRLPAIAARMNDRPFWNAATAEPAANRQPVAAAAWWNAADGTFDRLVVVIVVFVDVHG